MKEELVVKIANMLRGDVEMCNLAVNIFKEFCTTRDDFLKVRNVFVSGRWGWSIHRIECLKQMNNISMEKPYMYESRSKR
jgi:hypothetical protein